MNFKWLDFKITNRCNRKCIYCGVQHDSPTAEELLPSEVISMALQDALEAGFTHFALLGGEPSLRDDLSTVFASFKGERRPESLMVITNGIRFNEDLYRALFSTNAAEATLVYSMDSLVAPNYKHQNPAVSMEYIGKIQNIAGEYSTRRQKRSVSVHTVISRENFNDIEYLIGIFESMGIDVSMGLVCPSRFIESGECEQYNEFTFEELRNVIAQLERLDGEHRLNFANRTLLEYLKLFPFGKLHMTSTCKAGRQTAIINPDGEVYPCISHSYLGGKSYGNIAKDSFHSIITRMHSFSCSWKESAACWDHFLWDRLALTFDL